METMNKVKLKHLMKGGRKRTEVYIDGQKMRFVAGVNVDISNRNLVTMTLKMIVDFETDDQLTSLQNHTGEVN